MKHIISFIFTFLSLFSYAQNSQNIQMDSQFSKIRLNIILPENLDNLNDNQLSRLNSKITNIVTESGLSGDANGAGSFLIYPKVLFNNINTVETGIANVYTASLDITLNIKQMQKNTIFASTSFTIKGYGNSKDLAISNAIQNFPSNNEKLNLFFINSKKKIIEYYNLICNDLISNSSTLAKQKKYDEAIGLLYMIPDDVNCYNSVQEAIISYYKLLQESICNSLILKVKTRIAARDFEGALNILMELDPSTSCKLEANKLIDICEKNISQEVVRQRRIELLRYRTDVELEKRRIDASRQIAVEYYRSRPKTITYNNLILL